MYEGSPTVVKKVKAKVRATTEGFLDNSRTSIIKSLVKFKDSNIEKLHIDIIT